MSLPSMGSANADSCIQTVLRALIVANPACLERSGLATDDLVRHCAAVGLEAEVHALADCPTSGGLETLLASGPDRVIIAGGDGTLHHVVNALLEAPRKPMPAVGLLPLGTANDFARSLGLPFNLKAALQAISTGTVRPVDLGWVNGTFFLNVVHLGSLAETSRHACPWLKHGVRGYAYALALAFTAWRVRPFEATWACGGESQTVRALHMAIANGRYFGGGMAISEQATLDDGQLDVAVLPARQGLRLPTVQRRRETTIALDVQDAPPMSLDGEPFQSFTRLEFRVLPAAIDVYASAPE